MKIMVTGGAGFIGSAVVRRAVNAGHDVLNIDKLTYAGDLQTVASVADKSNYQFNQIDIVDRHQISLIVQDFEPDWIFHLAAETHVDRSIENPNSFVVSNVMGTTNLLDLGHTYWSSLSGRKKSNFRFIAVSTDEVFGSLDEAGHFSETSNYDPSSPYSASKAAADQLSIAWYRTYGFPVIVTNCSNNFGPYQHPEKLIPTVISTALQGEDIPIYGAGQNVRDWLYVDDHVNALFLAAEHGVVGERYCVGGSCEKTNLEIVSDICRVLDKVHARDGNDSFFQQVKFVEDRPGHDFRYSIDSSKIQGKIGWCPRVQYVEALAKTVHWFLDNPNWMAKAGGRKGLVKTDVQENGLVS